MGKHTSEVSTWGVDISLACGTYKYELKKKGHLWSRENKVISAREAWGGGWAQASGWHLRPGGEHFHFWIIFTAMVANQPNSFPGSNCVTVNNHVDDNQIEHQLTFS